VPRGLQSGRRGEPDPVPADPRHQPLDVRSGVVTARYWIKSERSVRMRGPYTSLATAEANLPEVLEAGDEYSIVEAASQGANEVQVASGSFAPCPGE